RLLEAGENAEQGGLTAPARADDAKEFALADGEGDRRERIDGLLAADKAAENLAHTADADAAGFERRFARRRPCCVASLLFDCHDRRLNCERIELSRSMDRANNPISEQLARPTP